MTPTIAWLIGILFLLLLIVVAVVSGRKERERTEILRDVAAAAGMAFEPTATVSAVRALGDVQLFTRGHAQQVTNLMTGVCGGQQAAVFDYRYTTGSGKDQNTHTQTVIMVPSAHGALPDLQMAPESPITRIAEVFGYQDIDIESSPEFSRRYVVKGADESAVKTALERGATAYFAEHAGWTVEARAGTVAIYRANSRPKPEDMRAFVEDACAAARTL